MSCTLKHFPGHGHDIGDSHYTQPIDHRTKKELAKDIQVFVHLLSLAGAVMPAHIIYAEVDSQNTALNSETWERILRKGIGFKGAKFTDCISMEGAQGKVDGLADLTLFCGQPTSNYEGLLRATKRPKSEESTKRIQFFYQPEERIKKCHKSQKIS